MLALVMVLAIVTIGVLAVLVIEAPRRRSSLADTRPARPVVLPPGGTEWRTTHRTDDRGRTEVAAVRVPCGADGPVLDRQVVALVEQDDPRWEASFAEAMSRARERVALLRVEDE